MKCPHCGFISRRDYDYCPYCGEKISAERDGLRRVIHIGRLFEVKLKTLLYLILANAFVLVFIIDIFLDFKYSIALFFLGAVIATVIVIEAFRIKKSIIGFLEKVDFWIVTFLLLCAFFLRFDGVFDARPYIICYVIPGFIIVSTFVLFLALLLLGSKTLKPIWSDALLFYHAAIVTALLVLMLVGEGIYKSNAIDWHNVPFIPYVVMMDQPGAPLGVAYLIEEILVIVSVAGSWLYVFDFNFILFGHIFREVRSSYGDRD